MQLLSVHRLCSFDALPDRYAFDSMFEFTTRATGQKTELCDFESKRAKELKVVSQASGTIRFANCCRS